MNKKKEMGGGAEGKGTRSLTDVPSFYSFSLFFLKRRCVELNKELSQFLLKISFVLVVTLSQTSTLTLFNTYVHLMRYSKLIFETRYRKARET